MTKTFLHVGCGPNHKAQTTRGFNTSRWNEVRLDIDASVSPDIIGSMTDMPAVASASMDALFSCHNIEHLNFHEVPVALAEFMRVLNDDGLVVIICPDLKSVSEMVVQGKLNDTIYTSPAGPITAMDVLYGYGKPISEGNAYMAHRCGFNEKLMKDLLHEAGFKVVATMALPEHFELLALASKTYRSSQDMQMIADQYFFR